MNSSKKILIVDDEELIALAMGKYFVSLGFEVDTAQELEEAQALLENFRYGLVIADLRLTGIGGVEGLQIVSDVRRKYPNTRVMLLSAYGTPEIEKESYNRGVDVFLHKPKAMLEIAHRAINLMESA